MTLQLNGKKSQNQNIHSLLLGEDWVEVDPHAHKRADENETNYEDTARTVDHPEEQREKEVNITSSKDDPLFATERKQAKDDVETALNPGMQRMEAPNETYRASKGELPFWLEHDYEWKNYGGRDVIQAKKETIDLALQQVQDRMTAAREKIEKMVNEDNEPVELNSTANALAANIADKCFLLSGSGIDNEDFMASREVDNLVYLVVDNACRAHMQRLAYWRECQRPNPNKQSLERAIEFGTSASQRCGVFLLALERGFPDDYYRLLWDRGPTGKSGYETQIRAFFTREAKRHTDAMTKPNTTQLNKEYAKAADQVMVDF